MTSQEIKKPRGVPPHCRKTNQTPRPDRRRVPWLSPSNPCEKSRVNLGKNKMETMQ